MATLRGPVPLWKKNVPWEILGPSHLLLGPGLWPFSQVISFYSIGVLLTRLLRRPEPAAGRKPDKGLGPRFGL